MYDPESVSVEHISTGTDIRQNLWGSKSNSLDWTTSRCRLVVQLSRFPLVVYGVTDGSPPCPYQYQLCFSLQVIPEKLSPDKSK